MKTLILIATLMFAFASQADINVLNEKDVPVPINDALFTGPLEVGKDITVVVTGLFSNGCYRWKEADVSHHPVEPVHQVRAIASVTEGMCLMVLVPFTKEVNLGTMTAGQHQVRFFNGPESYMEKTISIQ